MSDICALVAPLSSACELRLTIAVLALVFGVITAAAIASWLTRDRPR